MPRELPGTIRYATENVGRTLLHVDFDSGESLMVLADDVQIESDSASDADEDVRH